MTYDDVFCECDICNTTFWQSYKHLFSRDGLSDVDLDTHAIDASASERTRKDSKLSFPSSEPFNTLQLTGPMMAGHLPRIFDVFDIFFNIVID